jgi:NtrC-family two-component system response regulator AlgB
MPLEPQRLEEILRSAEKAPGKNSTERVAVADCTDGFSTENPLVLATYRTAWKVAATKATVLITGENGTGKSVLARAIHQRSLRSGKPFITVNCPSLQARLVESELFGHVRGAFTGAVNDAMGKVAAAEGGTLFLDEVGELPLEIQPKLLRLLQDRQYERLGESKTRQADVRVIAATNRDLKQEVAKGRFREDLFYRLNVIALPVLPLRHRPEDILPAAEQFLEIVSGTMGRRFRGFTTGARELLQTHRWPGNLRELRNAVERAAILSDDAILEAADFGELAVLRSGEKLCIGDFVSLATVSQEHVRVVMDRAANYQEAASILGINTSTLYRWRKRTEAAVAAFEAEPLAECAG